MSLKIHRRAVLAGTMLGGAASLVPVLAQAAETPATPLSRLFDQLVQAQ